MDTLNTPTLKLTSVSAVIVVGAEMPDDDLIVRLSDIITACSGDSEIVIIANGVEDGVAMELKTLIDRVPDTTVHFLAQRVDRDVAVLLGMDNAIGDWVLLSSPSPEEIDALPVLLSAASEGFDVLIAEGGDVGIGGGPFYRNWRRLFVAVYNMLSGYEVEIAPSPLRLYSRSAAVHITRQRGGEMLIKSRSLASGFPVRHLKHAYKSGRSQTPRTWIDSMGKAVRAIVSSSATPIRVVGALGVLTGTFALLYSVYVVFIYLTRDGIQPGWTTLSLQLAGFMFLFSMMFALLAEYIIQIHASAPPRRNHTIVREIRSRHTSRRTRLNVVNETGTFLDPPNAPAFHLGAGDHWDPERGDPS